MKPDEFLKLADRLSKAGDPASCRSATSRAYYAVFHATIALLSTKGFAFKQIERSHTKLVQTLQNSKDATVSSVGDEMSDLLAERRKADYDLFKAAPEGRSTAATNVATATALIAKLTNALNGPAGPAAVQAMRKYATGTLGMLLPSGSPTSP